MMEGLSCKEEYGGRDVGTCRECYEEAGETEEELKREIEDLKAKVNFLRLHTLVAGPNYATPRPNAPSFSDVVLVASDSADPHPTFPPIPAHRAVLISRSPVFRAMLENKMEESLSGTIKIIDVSYEALRAFVSYLYTADANLDEHMACDLLVLAEKYEVKHLKTYCEKYLMSKLNWENSLAYYAFAHQHCAKSLLDAALSLIVDNMDKLTKQEEYMELVEKDPRVVVDIYEAYLSKQKLQKKYRSDDESNEAIRQLWYISMATISRHTIHSWRLLAVIWRRSVRHAELSGLRHGTIRAGWI